MKNVIVVGNTTRQPELRFTATGKEVVAFGVAVNNRRRNASGEWEDADPDFYNVTAWGDIAVNVAESVNKGERVIVAGHLTYRKFERSDGTQGSAVEIVAEEVGHSLKWATTVATRTSKGRERTAAPAPETSTTVKPGHMYDDEEMF